MECNRSFCRAVDAGKKISKSERNSSKVAWSSCPLYNGSGATGRDVDDMVEGSGAAAGTAGTVGRAEDGDDDKNGDGGDGTRGDVDVGIGENCGEDGGVVADAKGRRWKRNRHELGTGFEITTLTPCGHARRTVRRRLNTRALVTKSNGCVGWLVYP
jgi:hypothetical protein